MHDALLNHAADLISQADALIIAAGAGMGVDSGLPDFRGREGFWRAYPALARARLDFHQVASPETFHREPALAWGFYGHRLKLYRNTLPHEGFSMLPRWGERMLQGHAVFTSNVDGQFQRAGFAPASIHECHGSIHHMQCLQPCGDHIWQADGFDPDVDTESGRLISELPRCPHCGGLARPNILMFGDAAWLDGREQAQAQHLRRWLAQVHRPVVIELGAGQAVPTALDVGLPMAALDALQALDQRLCG